MPTAIVGAMPQEIELLRQALGNPTPESLGPFTLYQGAIHGTPVLLLESGIGKVNAALCISLLIERHQPEHIINIGTAGGIDRKLSPGSVVIATELRYWDVDARGFGYDMGQVPGMPQSYQPTPHQLDTSALGFQVDEGLVVSGDSFVSDPELVQRIASDFPAAKLLDMESAAVAQVCYLMNTPYTIIRSLSDFADGEALATHESHLSLCAERTTAVATALL